MERGGATEMHQKRVQGCDHAIDDARGVHRFVLD